MRKRAAATSGGGTTKGAPGSGEGLDSETLLTSAFEAHPEIRALVTDLLFAEMDGTALAANLRALRPGLEVLFISGYPPGSLAPESRAQFLAKPFGPEDLLEAIDRWRAAKAAPERSARWWADWENRLDLTWTGR